MHDIVYDIIDFNYHKDIRCFYGKEIDLFPIYGKWTPNFKNGKKKFSIKNTKTNNQIFFYFERETIDCLFFKSITKVICVIKKEKIKK